jgi:hypothetical protein
MKNINEFVGKKVLIYPGDTRAKFGIVIEVNDNGVLFQITSSQDERYNVGSYWFVSYSANLNFSLAK